MRYNSRMIFYDPIVLDCHTWKSSQPDIPLKTSTVSNTTSDGYKRRQLHICARKIARTLGGTFFHIIFRVAINCIWLHTACKVLMPTYHDILRTCSVLIYRHLFQYQSTWVTYLTFYIFDGLLPISFLSFHCHVDGNHVSSVMHYYTSKTNLLWW